MKKLIIFFLVVFLFTKSYSQTNDRLAISILYGGNISAELSYKHTFSEYNLWVNPFIGISNQDVNSNYDDFFTGLKIGLPIFKFEKSFIYSNIFTGIYFPNNDFYKQLTPFAGIDAGYEYTFGKNQQHSVFLEAGYNYGKSTYIKTYENENFSVSSENEFMLSPIRFSFGYGYYF